MSAILNLLAQAETFYRRALAAGDTAKARRHAAIWRTVWVLLCSKTGNAGPVQQ